jgi:membrane-associated phospholipid phosphatase
MDEALLRALNSWTTSPAVAAIAIFLSSVWMLLLTTVPLAAILIAKKRWWAIASITLAMSATDAFNARLLKPLIARERPCRALTGLSTVTPCNVGKSFASGHAAVAFAFAVSAGAAARWTIPFLGPLAVLVASSRVVLGVHYPSDVAAGALIGAAVGYAVDMGRRRMERPAALSEIEQTPAP